MQTFAKYTMATLFVLFIVAIVLVVGTLLVSSTWNYGLVGAIAGINPISDKQAFFIFMGIFIFFSRWPTKD